MKCEDCRFFQGDPLSNRCTIELPPILQGLIRHADRSFDGWIESLVRPNDHCDLGQPKEG